MKSLRIRNKAKVTELNFTSEQLKAAQKVIASGFERHNRVQSIRDLLNAHPCRACDDIPVIKLTYPLKGGGRVLEFYCDKCSKALF